MEKKLLDIIKQNKLFVKGDRVCVAVSGGADSVALLVLLNKLKKELGITLVGVHINHHIRGEESDQDMKYVELLSKNLGLDLEVVHVDAINF